MKKKTLAEKLSLHLSPPNEHGCILWEDRKDKKGYGVIKTARTAAHPHGLNQMAHRIAWEISFGHPGALHVLHKCDTPNCCNVEHLFLGTNRDNINDRIKKGRTPTKLTDEAVAKIRSSSESQTVLARRFGTSQTNISSIRRGRTRKAALIP